MQALKRDLREDDLYEVLPSYNSQTLGDKLEKMWNMQQFKNNSSILLLLWNSFGWDYIFISLTQIISMTITVLRPKIIKKLLPYFLPGYGKLDKIDGWFYGMLLIIITIIEHIYRENFRVRTKGLGIKVRTAFCSLMYRKVLKMRSSEMESITPGKIVNLMTKDVNDVEIFVSTSSYTWTGIVRFLVTCYVLYVEIGWSLMTIILGTFCIIIPVQIYLGVVITSLRMKTSKKSDERCQLTTEVLSAIKTIKLHSWEKHFRRKLAEVRKTEIHILHKVFLWLFTELTLAELAVNITWYLLIISIWFGIMNTLNAVSVTLKVGIPKGIYETAKFVTAINRIGSVLTAVNTTSSKKKYNAKPKIVIKNMTVIIKNRKILDNVNLELNNNLIALSGNTGSGKSLLLKTIMKEHEEFIGSLNTDGRISYASQEPWLFPSTIRQNILFGSNFEEKRYLEVLRVCALTDDLKLFPNGDCTIVGDKGNNLSTGQKIRINLARTIYKDFEIYLLDNCLSALDAETADFIFDKCINKFLKNKLVIMVTQNLKHINQSKNVILLKNQKAELIKPSPNDDIKNFTNSALLDSKIYEMNERNLDTENLNEEFIDKFTTQKKLYEERKKFGKIRHKIYKQYIDLGGGLFMFLLVILTFALSRIIKSGKEKIETSWLHYCRFNIEHSIVNYTAINCTTSQGYKKAIEARIVMCYLYPMVIIIATIMVFMKAFANYNLAKKASMNVHQLIAKKILYASTTFFNSNFVGNILNRFSKDLLSIDEIIPITVYNLFEPSLKLIALLIITSTLNVIFPIVALMLLAVLFKLRKYYVKIGRDLKQLESTTRSPIIGYVIATLDGLTTIRTLKTENILREEFDRHQNLHTSACYIYSCCLGAFGVIIKICSTLFAAIIVVGIQYTDNVSQSLSLMAAEGTGIRQWAEFENQMVSMERLSEYTEIKKEDGHDILTENRPLCGDIKFQNIHCSYEHSANILKNISFTVKSKEKVAIIGRTGSGKSSIISSLFRLCKTEGKIFIDSIDITSLSLEFLRSNISVVPSEPVLFSGTIRDNIDPTGKHPDREIWNIIRAVNLDDVISSLEFKVKNAGSNFSTGQKQLICLGRAIIRNNEIVIFDGITENVDPNIENIIHNIIQQHFASSTVIFITHKLNFMYTYHRLLELNKGKIVEYDGPLALLQNKNGMFNHKLK
ncbi:ABC membrane domain containing protein, partial [Asbolus verrucosus]